MKFFMILLMIAAFFPVYAQAPEYTNVDSFYFEYTVNISGDPVDLHQLMLVGEADWWIISAEGKAPKITILLERDLKRNIIKYNFVDAAGVLLFSRPLHFMKWGKYHTFDGSLQWKNTNPFLQFRINFSEIEEGSTNLKVIAECSKPIESELADLLVQSWQYHFQQFHRYVIIKNSEKLRKYLSND